MLFFTQQHLRGIKKLLLNWDKILSIFIREAFSVCYSPGPPTLQSGALATLAMAQIKLGLSEVPNFACVLWKLKIQSINFFDLRTAVIDSWVTKEREQEGNW